MPRQLLAGLIAMALLGGALGCGRGGDDDRVGDPGPITTGVTGSQPTLEPPWSAGPPSGATVEGDDPADVLVVGDSLVLYSDVERMADVVSGATRHDATAVGVTGATWVTYGRPEFQTGNRLAWEYATEQEAVLTVIALATNDARLLTQYPDQYSAQEQAEVMAATVDRVLGVSRCVLLVTVAGRDDTEGMDRSATDTVNANLVAEADASGGSVRVADWEAISADHTEWFTPGDVHFTGAGYAAYRAFIGRSARDMLDDCGPPPS